MYDLYTETIASIERLHRRCLQVIKVELERQNIRDINNVQALILFNIGNEELTVGELTLRGCYHGSNVSYNLKKLVEQEYVHHMRSPHDRRSFRVKLTDKGQQIRSTLQDLFQDHATRAHEFDVTEEKLTSTRDALQSLDRFWSAASDTYSV